MPLHGIGQSPHDSFLVMYLSTTEPSVFMPLLASGKCGGRRPRRFWCGAARFRTGRACAAVVPGSLHSWRIDAVGDCILFPSRVIIRYSQPSHFLGLAKYANSRATKPRSRLYSSVI